MGAINLQTTLYQAALLNPALTLKARSFNVLAREGKATVGDVLKLSAAELAGMRNMVADGVVEVLNWQLVVRVLLDPAPDLTDPAAVASWLTQE